MADQGYGADIAFSTGFFAEILSFSRSGRQRNKIDTTHMQTADGWMTSQPSDLRDPGIVTVQLLYDPDAEPPLEDEVEEITITFPIPPGMNAGATEVCDGYLLSFEEEVPLDDRMTATAVIQFTGKPVRTPAS